MLEIRVTPHGGADRADGVGPTGELLVRVRAAAHGGEATEACLRTVADAHGLPRSRVTLVRGATTRRKLVRVDDVDREEIATRWPGLRLSA